MTRAELALMVGVPALAGAVAWAMRPASPVLEVTAPAPQVLQADHSVVAAREVASQPSPAPHIIPKGFRETRRAQVVVAPVSTASDVQLDLSWVNDGREQRLVASSPDGTVERAVDMPIVPIAMPRATPIWGAGLEYGRGGVVGLWIDRDIGRLRLGTEVQRQADGRAQTIVRVGVRW